MQGVVGAFANDPRILAWDLWNEPNNGNGGAYGAVELKNKAELVLALLPQVFAWARSANPSQPLDQWSLGRRLVVAGEAVSDRAKFNWSSQT